MQTSSESLTLLIDADILIYRITLANEEATRWPGNRWTLHSDGDKCCRQLDREIRDLKEELGANYVALCYSDPSGDYFRRDLAPELYKSKRDGRKPLAYAAVREYAEGVYSSHWYPKLEGDDIMGLLQRDNTIIVSEDKDMLTIPGWLYRKGELTKVSPIEADYNWLTQTLTGDQTDGYPGCPGVGPVRAKRMLNVMWHTVDDLFKRVVQAYGEAGLSEADALLQARLARILRRGEYNEKTGKVKLWKPKIRA